MVDDADRTHGKLRNDSRPYPYLVIRWMAAVYGTAEIRFVAIKNDAEVSDGLTIVAPSYREGTALDASARRAVIGAARTLSEQRRSRMCIVFGSNDAVYIEPNGKCSRSNNAPSGGLRIDKVK